MVDANEIDLFYLKKLIKNKEVLCKDITEELSYSQSYIYDVLNKRRNFSYTFFADVIKKFNIEYYLDDAAYKQCYELIIKLAIDIIKDDNEQLKQLMDQYQSKRNYYEKSRSFVFVSLIDFIISYRKKEYSNYEHFIEECNVYLPFYDDSIAFIYLLFFTFINPIEKNLTKVASFYDYCLANYKINDINDYVKGYLYFQLGKINSIKADFFKSYQYFQWSIQCFKNVFLINRVVGSEIQIGCLYADMLQVDKAIEQLEKCLVISNEHRLIYRIRNCYNNLAFLYFYNGNYAKAKENVEHAITNGSSFPTLNYITAYISLIQDPRSKSRSVISHLIEREEDLFTARVLKLIQALANNNELKLAKYFGLALHTLQETNNLLEIILLHRMIILYLQDNKKETTSLIYEKSFLKITLYNRN